MEKRRVLAWSVQAIIVTKTIRIIKPRENQKHSASGLFHSDSDSEGKIVVYRGYFVRLLSQPKPLRDQLLIELPTLQAFRTGEIGTVDTAHIDVEHGDIQILDSKKHRLFTLPLDATVADHLDKYIHSRNIVSGPIFKPEKRTRPRKPNSKTKGVGLSLSYIQRVWRKWCDICSIPYMSPRYGRAYFACVWHYVEHKSMFGLMTILRHDDILATQKYLSKIIDYAAVKAEFNRGKKSPFSSLCTRFDSCPLAAPNCYCRMFQPKIEVNHKI